MGPAVLHGPVKFFNGGKHPSPVRGFFVSMEDFGVLCGLFILHINQKFFVKLLSRP